MLKIILLISFSMKTGLLKWRPDYDIAADCYTKAGKILSIFKYTIYGNLNPIVYSYVH